MPRSPTMPPRPRHAGGAGRRPQRPRGRDGRGHRRRGAHRRSSIRSARTRCRSCWGCCRKAPLLLSPDSGPAHMATMVGAARDRPVRRHQSGARRARTTAGNGASTSTTRPRESICGKPAAQIPWTTKIERRRRHGPDQRERCDRQARRADGRASALRCAHERNQGPRLPRRTARQDHHPAHQVAAHERPRQGLQRAPRTARARGNLERLGLRQNRHRRRRERPAARQRAAVGDRRRHPRQGTRAGLRCGIHPPGAGRLLRERRARRHQAAHQHHARLEHRRRKILPRVQTRVLDPTRRSGRGRDYRACTPRRSRGTSPSRVASIAK